MVRQDPAQPVSGLHVPRRPAITRFLRGAVYVLVVLLAWLTWSISNALFAPGTDTTSARLAEWGRGHGLGWAVTLAEHAQYRANPPTIGGLPSGGIPDLASQRPPSKVGRSAQRSRSHTSPRPAQGSQHGATTLHTIPPQVEPALRHEGRWQTLISTHGKPVVRAAFLRPDSTHTSYVVGVAWLDQNLVRSVLHPGTDQPGGQGWDQPSVLDGHDRTGLLATFNSGFRLPDARGGYWQGGKQVGVLRNGAASMVVDKSGRVDVVSWRHGERPPSNLVAVRQNLDLLIDNGKLSENLHSTNTRTWGKTVGNAAYVWRSGLGVRSDGSLVVVVGPALSVESLGHILLAAGSVRAMELDINQDWTNFMTYHRGQQGFVPRPLTSDEHPNPGRYLVSSSRDFVAVYRR